jgi:hypothetical protein
MGLFDRFRKDTVNDPFGGDGDFYDEEESRFAGKGPKIALAASGVTFAAVVGFIAYVLLSAPETEVAAPVVGSFADLEIVDEPADAAPAPAAGAPPPVADATAVTDRSAERRPWLTAATEPAAAPRPGAGAKPAAPPAAPPAATPAKPAIAPPTTTAAVTPPAASAPPATAAKPAAVPATAAKPAPPAPVEAKPAAPAAKETQVAAIPPVAAPVAPPGAKPAATPPAATPPAATAKPDAAKPEPVKTEAPAATDEVPSLIAGIPALSAAGVSPGAPERFAASGDAGPAVAGGRPRLVDPPLPPTDRVAIGAPPPRFAALRDIKKETPAAPSATAPKLAVVVRGLGLSQSATETAIMKLPANVTLAFSPYARNLKSWVERAKAQGHEVLVEVPLESKAYPAEDPGPLGLLTTLELKDNTERLDAIIKASSGATGVFDAMGTKFRESDPHIAPLFAKLKEQNLFYVQGSPGIRVGEPTIPTATADVVLDERPFRAAIDARLDYAERLARYQGSAIASLNAKPVSFERLVLWLEQAQKKGLVLAKISDVLIRGENAAAPAAPAAAPTTAKTKPGEPAAPAAAKPRPGNEAAAKAKAKT